MSLIDAHVHFWRLDRGDYSWLTPDLGALHRDILPSDFLAMARAADVTGAILVEAAQTSAETDFLLDLAESHRMICGVVGWIDLRRREAPAQIRALADRKGLCGVRANVENADALWLADAAQDMSFVALAEAGLTLDVLARTDQLELVAARASRTPGLRIVLNHLGRPPLAPDAAESMQAWGRGIAALADHPNVFCKLSGLLARHASSLAVQTAAERALDLFGPDRTLWGSDWPVLELEGRYEEWLAVALKITGGLSPGERAAVFGGSAQRAYALEADR